MHRYVLVTSINPLVIYLYDEGLVRLCTKKYKITKKNLKDSFVHLTNYSINKDSEDFRHGAKEDAEDTSGHKWRFTALKKWWSNKGIDVDKIMADIRLLIAKTFVAAEGEVHIVYLQCQLPVCNRILHSISFVRFRTICCCSGVGPLL